MLENLLFILGILLNIWLFLNFLRTSFKGFGLKTVILDFLFVICSIFVVVSPNPEEIKPASGIVAEQLRGGESSHSFLDFLGKRKKFDLAFHRRLEQHFPDWKERMDYQKKQEQFYKSAMIKKREIKRLRLLENSDFYTKEEFDAIAYFEGTGNYAKYQDSRTKPNIFDSRQSFLLKMHDERLRNEFLNSFNRINN